MLKQTRCMYSRALHCTAAHSESDEEWRVEYFIVADLLFPVIKRSPHSMDSVCNSFNRQRVIRNGGAEKYENGGNQRSRAAPQIRRVLSRPKNDRFWRVFYPIPPIFLHFHPFHAHTKPILQKNQVWLAFFGRGGGSKFLPQLREGRHRLLY